MFIPILYLGRCIISINIVQMDWTHQHQDNEHELAYLVSSGGWENHMVLNQQMISKALMGTLDGPIRIPAGFEWLTLRR